MVATVAVLAAAAGPLYLDTANDSVLHSTLESNTVAANGISILPNYSSTVSGSPVARAQQALAAASRFGLYHFLRQG